MRNQRKRRQKKRSIWQRLYTGLDKLDPDRNFILLPSLGVILFLVAWWTEGWKEAVQVTTFIVFLSISSAIGMYGTKIIIAGLKGENDRKDLKVTGILIAVVTIAFLAMLFINYNADMWYKVILAGLGFGSAVILLLKIVFRLWRW